MQEENDRFFDQIAPSLKVKVQKEIFECNLRYNVVIQKLNKELKTQAKSSRNQLWIARFMSKLREVFIGSTGGAELGYLKTA